MARPRKVDQFTGMPDLACDDRIVHVEAVKAARAVLPSSELVAGVSALFATMGDPTRLRILAVLAQSELCVCDLAATIGQSESATSHQLRAMRQQGLVRPRRDGRLVYYALDDDHVGTLYRHAIEHVNHRQEEAPDDR